jgi:hypothetical protein
MNRVPNIHATKNSRRGSSDEPPAPALRAAPNHMLSVPIPKIEIQKIGKMNFAEKVCADDRVLGTIDRRGGA